MGQASIHHLVLVEHDRGRIKSATLNTITLSRELGGTYALLVLGSGIADVAESVRGFGAVEVLVADDALLAEPQAERYAAVLADVAERLGVKTVLGPSSSFTKDVLPRTSALLDAGMVSNVAAVQTENGTTHFRYPVSSGSHDATVCVEGDCVVLTVQASAFPLAEPVENLSPVVEVPVNHQSIPQRTRWKSREDRESNRPELGEARVVVSGGRPLKDGETFERLIGGLADALGGAVGATRAAVDAGMVPNDCQVGQTGIQIAPELYIAVGVSGAIQHLAGIKDSRVIVAINRDPEAPLFQVANYGLVGDLYQVVPELIEALNKD